MEDVGVKDLSRSQTGSLGGQWGLTPWHQSEGQKAYSESWVPRHLTASPGSPPPPWILLILQTVLPSLPQSIPQEMSTALAPAV